MIKTNAKIDQSIQLPGLEEVIDRNSLIVNPETSIVDAIALMSQARGQSVPLHSTDNLPDLHTATQKSSSYVVAVDGRQLVGVFTETDVVKLIASGSDLSAMKISQVISPPATILHESKAPDTFTALSVMRQHQISHLPIVSDRGQLIGIVTNSLIREILEPSSILKMRYVSEIMTTQVIQSPKDVSLLTLAKLMAFHRVSCVVIVENKTLENNRSRTIPVGIITERDLVQFQVLELDLSKIQVVDVMSTPLFCLSPSDSLWQAHQLMRSKQVRRLVVVSEGGELAGIVTQTNLLRVLDPVEMSKVITLLQHQVEKQTVELFHCQRLEILGALASGVAHDFNNILTPILATAQVLQLQLPHLDQQTQDLLSLLENNSRRGAELVQQILFFARKAEEKMINLQLGHLLLEVVRLAKITFPKSIEICRDIPNSRTLWNVLADATQLHQVFMNLCINARDAMPNGGTLTICVENVFVEENLARMNTEARVGPYVLISIADTGVGIPEEIKERIFEPFFTTKEENKGTGLGLSTVTSIIKNHQGFINVYSEVGKGTQFKVYLPAVEVQTSEVETQLKLLSGNGELILIVDDEATIRQIAKEFLEKYNYRTLLASDGMEAVSLYKKHNQAIDVVLMDMMMPSIDGLTAVSTLQEINPQVKIIATSGILSKDRLALIAAAGIKDFVSKPYTITELLNILHKVLVKP